MSDQRVGLKIKPEFPIPVAAFDQVSRLSDFRMGLRPIAELIAADDLPAVVSGGLQYIGVRGRALWDDHHPVHRQVKLSAQRLVMLIATREQMARIGVKHDAGGIAPRT